MIRHLFCCLILLVSVFAVRASVAHAWGNDGHEIVAYIAADNLTPNTREAVARILQVSNRPEGVAEAMAAASILPDTEFSRRDPTTMSWHFINLCLQDNRQAIPTRCSNDCVVAKIDDYAARLRTTQYDKWGAAGDLAFLIHFVGDINQPLHAATNDDQGGNCISIEPVSDIHTLHVFWDVQTVTTLENHIDSGDPQKTASLLTIKYKKDYGRFVWNSNTAQDLAWQSNLLARLEIYDALKIPLEPCAPKLALCTQGHQQTVKIEQSYLDREITIAGKQLAKAGFALASLLNSIWK